MNGPHSGRYRTSSAGRRGAARSERCQPSGTFLLFDPDTPEASPARLELASPVGLFHKISTSCARVPLLPDVVGGMEVRCEANSRMRLRSQAGAKPQAAW